MMAAPSFLLLFLLGSLALLLVLLGAIFISIATKRVRIVPAVLGLVLLGLLGAAVSVVLYFGVEVHPRNATARGGINTYPPVANRYIDPTELSSQADRYLDPTEMPAQPVYQRSRNFSALFSGPFLFLAVIAIAFIVGQIARQGTMSQTADRFFRRGWAAIPLVIIFGLFFMRFSSRTYTNVKIPPAVPTKVAPASRETWEVKQARERYVSAMNTHRSAAEIEDARKKFIVALNKQAARDRRTQPKQLAKTPTDIHAEMEQFDAPRIPLSPEAPEATSAPAAAITSTKPGAAAKSEDKPAGDDKASAKSKQVDAEKIASASVQVDQKSDKTLAAGSPEPPTSEPEKTTKKPAAPPSEQAMIAEAEPGKPKARPAWTDELPKRTGSTYREVIATDEYQSIDECYQAADVYLLLRAYQRIQELAGRPQVNSRLPSLTFSGKQILSDDGQIIWEDSGYGGGGWNDRRLYWLASMGIGADYVRREIVAKDPTTHEPHEFIDTLERSIGPMKKLYLQIEFTPAVDNDLRRHWESYYQQERLAVFGISAGSLLAFLGVVFAMLKFDTATKGYYTKRLFLGVPAAIIGALILLKFLDEYTSLL